MWNYSSETAQIKCLVAPGSANDEGTQSISQIFEQWSGGGCTHRCDGVMCERVVIKPRKDPKTGQQAKDQRGNALWDVDEFEEACSCDHDHTGDDKLHPCKLTTRLKVMLPDTKDMGLWRLESHGQIFGSEVMAALEKYREFNMGPVYCILTLGWQEMKKPGQPTSKFVVPSLSLDPNPPNFAKVLVESTLGYQLQALAGANDGARALEAPTEAQKIAYAPLEQRRERYPDEAQEASEQEAGAVEAELVEDAPAGAKSPAGRDDPFEDLPATVPTGTATEEIKQVAQAEPVEEKPSADDLMPMPAGAKKTREESMKEATEFCRANAWPPTKEFKALCTKAGYPWHYVINWAMSTDRTETWQLIEEFASELAAKNGNNASLANDARGARDQPGLMDEPAPPAEETETELTD